MSQNGAVFFHGLMVPTNNSGAHEARVTEILQFLRPVPCTFPLIRLGGTTDGAYLLPDDLVGIAACFSPGVNNFKNFEDEILQRFDINAHMCDRSSDADRLRTPLVAGRQTFKKLWLDVNNAPDSISLDDWVAELAPDGNDLLLQMDIEGAEYRNLIRTSVTTLQRFRIIVLELHGLDKINNPHVAREVLAPMCSKLAQHFVVVHAHPNNCNNQVPVLGTQTRIPPVLEVTLLRRDRLLEGPVFPPQLPHPLDVGRNVPRRAPEFLDETWYDGPRSHASDKKVADDLASWAEDHKRNRVQDESLAKMMGEIGQQLTRLYPLIQKAPAPLREESSEDTIADLAQGKSFVLNAAYGSMPKKGKVGLHEPFFFHTALMAGPRITIDLERSVRINRIVLTNRSNGFQFRADGLIAILHDTADAEKGEGFVFPRDPSFLNGSRPDCMLELGSKPARFVTITSPLHTALHFSAIKILG
jgi:hypothetical protein